jgi:glutathione S-transferase
VTLLTIIVYFQMSLKVSQARTRHNVPPPAMSGPEEFMRIMRVHENTLEGLMMFLPALWLFAVSTQDLWAAVIGAAYPIGRLLYARGYYEEASKRGRGFLIGFFSTAILLVGGLLALSVIAFKTYG